MAHLLLDIRRISKHFGGVVAVNDVSVQLTQGQVLGLIGPNGAGKTTIFNLICGVYQINSGEIWFDGEEISGDTPAKISRRGIGRTFQVPHTFNQMTLIDNLTIPLLGSRAKNGERRQRVFDTLVNVNLFDKRDSIAAMLSTGERQLLQFCQVSIRHPKLLILDEPFAGAGPEIIDTIVQKIADFATNGGACLVISHDIESMPRICNEVVVLVEGAVLTSGSFQDVRKDPRVIEAYLGS